MVMPPATNSIMVVIPLNPSNKQHFYQWWVHDSCRCGGWTLGEKGCTQCALWASQEFSQQLLSLGALSYSLKGLPVAGTDKSILRVFAIFVERRDGFLQCLGGNQISGRDWSAGIWQVVSMCGSGQAGSRC